MKENEFDIYIRNLMEEAEEPVSTEVWEGISAALDTRKRVVPLWMWRSFAGVAAAAAVVTGVFLFRPTADNSQPVTILNPVAEAVSATPSPEEAPAAEDEVFPILQQLSHKPERTAFIPEIQAVPKETEETAETFVPDSPVSGSVPARDPSKTSQENDFTDDGRLLDALATAPAKNPFKPSLSLNVGGNLQSNSRPEIQPATMRRTSGMFILPGPPADGLSNAQPESHFSLPLTVGVGARLHISPRWSIGTGIQYTNMSRTFVADYGDAEAGIALYGTSVDNHQHWLGIPLNVHFDIVRAGRWSVSAFAGTTAEYLVKDQYLIQHAGDDILLEPKAHGMQYSTGGGVGVQFALTPLVSLYFDPSLRYYFDCDQPRSIRTIQPLRFDMQAGVRFNFGQ